MSVTETVDALLDTMAEHMPMNHKTRTRVRDTFTREVVQAIADHREWVKRMMTDGDGNTRG